MDYTQTATPKGRRNYTIDDCCSSLLFSLVMKKIIENVKPIKRREYSEVHSTNDKMRIRYQVIRAS